MKDRNLRFLINLFIVIAFIIQLITYSLAITNGYCARKAFNNYIEKKFVNNYITSKQSFKSKNIKHIIYT